MLCLRYSRTREEAEETLQEGFIKVFEFLHQFKYMGSFEGWVRKIMLNCALQKYRGHAHLHSVLSMDQVPEERLAYEEILPAIDEKELLFLVQQLPTAYRLIFNLYVFEGLKHREIAVLLGISEGTSKSNLFDARALLKKWVLQTTKPANKKTAAYE